MCANRQTKMGRTRALLTKRDRELLVADPDELTEKEENRKYQTVSEVRNRIREELPKDLEVLREHHPALLEELREVACAEEAKSPDPVTSPPSGPTPDPDPTPDDEEEGDDE